MYQAIYKCQLCGKIIKDKILMQPHVAHTIMIEFMRGNEEAVKSVPHTINIRDFHECEDGSFGCADFQGFKKVED